jgi:hypothetical protein
MPKPVRRERYKHNYAVYRSLYPHAIEDLHALAQLDR